MKKITKFLTLGLSAMLAVSLVACGSASDETTTLENDYVKVEQFIGLPIAAIEAPPVTDEHVEFIINRALEETAVQIDITGRAIEEGDTVVMDFVGKVDGEAFDGGSAEGAQLEIGSQRFIGATDDYAGFEEQIIGHQIGDEFQIEVQFPEPYPMNEDLAGAVATFDITLHSAFIEEIPELTDEWVQENSETATTVDEYVEEIRATIEDGNRNSVAIDNQNLALQTLMQYVTIKEIPEEMVEREIELVVNFYVRTAASYQMEFEEFLIQMMGMDLATFDANVRELAFEMAARRQATLLIADSEGLRFSDAEYDEEKERLALESGMASGEQLVEELGEEFVRSTILQLRVADFLVERRGEPVVQDDAHDHNHDHDHDHDHEGEE